MSMIGTVVVDELLSDKHELAKMLAKTSTPMIATRASAPFNIVACNSKWRALCGYGKEAVGMPPTILQGEMTGAAFCLRTSVFDPERTFFPMLPRPDLFADMKKAAKFRRDLVGSGAARTTLVNYTKDGTAFAHAIRAEKVVIGGAEYFLTEGDQVSDVNVTRAILRERRLSVDEQGVFNAVAILLTYVVIVALAPALQASSKWSTGSAIDLVPVAACTLTAIAVGFFVTAVAEPAYDPPHSEEPNHLGMVAVATLLGLFVASAQRPYVDALAVAAVVATRIIISSGADSAAASSAKETTTGSAAAKVVAEHMAEVVLSWGVGVAISVALVTLSAHAVEVANSEPAEMPLLAPLFPLLSDGLELGHIYMW